ncbi:MAG: GNAT family N-acetyltransferase [Gaiellaceae bacterium]
MAEIEIAREPYGSPVSRPLTDAQAEELVERYGGLEGAGAEPEPELFEDPDGYFLVARLDGSPVGCAGICRCEGAQTAELRRMYVAPEVRRTGVARALVTALEEKARELGYGTLRLETGPEQPEAVHLYETSGFTVIPNFGPYSGQRRSICMEKPLR